MEAGSLLRARGVPLDGISGRVASARGTLRSCVELTKPRITSLVVASAAAGFLLGAASLDLVLFAHTLLGVALVASGTSAMNQVLERDVDALMRRTRSRPLPTGRIGPRAAAVFSGALAAGGIAWLWVGVNGLTALLALATFVSYDFVYTPLKRVHSLSTIIGAVPGGAADPWGLGRRRRDSSAPAAGRCSASSSSGSCHTSSRSRGCCATTTGRPGLRMLSVGDAEGRQTRRYAVLYALALIPVSLVPSVLGLTPVPCTSPPPSSLGAAFLWTAARLSDARRRPRGRGVCSVPRSCIFLC